MTPAEKRSILIVDDEVELLRFLREALGSLANCQIYSTSNPEYAFELSLKQQFDLFLFDFSMPKVDGAVLYGFIRTTYLYAPGAPRAVPPLLLMSGHGDRERARQLLREPGVRGLLPKPFSLDHLLRMIETCLPGVTRRLGAPEGQG